MKCTIKSKKLNKVLTFSVPGLSYIFVDLNGREGTLGNQICKDGDLCGDSSKREMGESFFYRVGRDR